MNTNIMTNGVELTDDELKALPIDHMAVWLDMWEEARDPAPKCLHVVPCMNVRLGRGCALVAQCPICGGTADDCALTEEALPTGSMSEWPEFAFEIFLTEEHDEPESYYEAIGIDDFDAYTDR